MAAQQYTTDQEGNRIIAGSKRPDGTVRKEIRVRQGYIPQDEQARFTSQGARARQGAQVIPGLDNAEVNGAQQSSASARTTQRRRPKKAPGTSTAAPVEQMAGLRVSQPPKPDTPAGTSSDAVNPGQEGDVVPAQGASNLEKAIKGLQKKLKACEALAKRQQTGDKLTGPEQDKLNKVSGWEAEVHELEQQLQAGQ